MTIYWVDPYLHNSTSANWGNGTTDNTTKEGSYQKPWNIEDMQTASSKSIDANSEIKIKGLSKTDLFVNLGKFYANSESYFSMDLVPATSNTNWAANRASSKYNSGGFVHVIDISESGVPDVSPQQKASDFPFIPTFNYYSSGTGSLEIRYSNSCGFWIATRVAGYNSASNPFPADIWGIRTGFNFANWGSGDDYNLFENNNITTVSAGWVNDTESTPSGYSLFFTSQSDTNENKYIKGGTNTQFNCSRFYVFNGNREYWNIRPQKNNTTHYFGGMADKSNNSNYSLRVSDQLDNDQKDIVIHHAGSEGNYYLRKDNTITVHTSMIQPDLYFYGNATSITDSNISRFAIGSLYTNWADITSSMFAISNYFSTSAGAVEYLQGSTYFSQQSNLSLEPANSSGNKISSLITDYRTYFPTNIYKSGTSGGWMANGSSTYSPSGAGGDFCVAERPYQTDVDLNKPNWWEATTFNDNRVAGTFMPVKVMGVLKCNGVNPRGAANTITFVNSQTESQGFYKSLLAFETNDYDQKPITLVPSSLGDCTYAYNETIGGENVLHFQGSATGSNIHRYPLELAVPSHTAGTDNLRIKLRLSKANYTDSCTVGYYYRKPDNSVGVYSASTSVANSGISSDSSSPSTHNLTFSLSATGTREINSLYINLGFKNQSTSAILRVHSAEVETY